MKNYIFIFVVAICVQCFSQNKTTKKLLEEIESEWVLDDNNNITYTKIIENINLSNEEIYNRALAYFTYNYGDGDSVVQINDKDQGVIVAKGLYPNTHIGVSLITYKYDTWHVLRIDIKEKRVRILLSLTNYNVVFSGGSTPDSTGKVAIHTTYPVNPKGKIKNQYGKAFYGSHLRAVKSLESLEKSIKESNTFKNKEDW